ncbi:MULTISPECIES: hypothetical protein [Pandoraea]|uniref:hypothetical protein n=1 Tax=Pandoraea TaxID=93217 RepID=UPI001F5D9DB3|nr:MULTISPECIES: hypothetical protein [Pandoraea]MCI3207150.1 hypothetical protein [Pandoraea sp. LA3]MDN4585179.1 hypothetical protein [Pandoraea capi]
MLPSSIPDISLVPPSDMEEASRASATPEVAQDIEGVVNIPEPPAQLPFPCVTPDPDTAFRFQSEFLGVAEEASEDIVAHWRQAVRRGGGTLEWRVFVARWQAKLSGAHQPHPLHPRYALFHLLIFYFGRLDARLRPLALECLLTDGPEGRAVVRRNWKRIGLGMFAREQWPVVQRLLREADMLR